MSSYSNNHNPLIDTAEEEIDLKEVVARLLQYKKSMLAITLGFGLLAGVLAYFKSDVYQANLTLQIESSTATQGDFMSSALGMQGNNLGNEVILLKSRFIAKNVLEKIQIGNRYYAKTGLHNIELYKQSPFTVKADAISTQLIGSTFTLKPVDSSHFQLIFEGNAKAPAYNKTHSYGTLIQHPLFRLTVNKLGELNGGEYSFTITPNQFMYTMVQSSLNVAMTEDKGSVLMLTYQDNVPQRAEDILNVIAEVYTEQSVKYKSNSAEKTLKFIDDQLAAIHEALQSSATNLKDYKSSHVLIDLGTKASTTSSQLNEYEAQLYKLKIQKSTLQTLLDHLKNNQEMTAIDLGPVSGNTATIGTLIQNIQSAKTLKASLLVDYTENHPSVLKVKEQLVSLKKSLVGTLESSLRSIDQRKTSLNALVDKFTKSFESLPEEEKQLTQLNRNFMVNEKIYEFLLQKRAETAIVESSTVSGVRVIDDALANPVASQPNRSLIVMMGLIIGFIFGILQAFVRNFMANTIQTISDLEGKTKLPLYSVLPLFKDKKSLYEDALRVLLTRLEFQAKKPKIITMTSSVQGEGRTTTALEFAKIIGQSGKKVIVLDLDMRSSRVNQKLMMPNDFGISTFLEGKSSLEDVTRSISSHVDVVVAGPVPENPYELIMSVRLKDLLADLEKSYDYIILESPPVGLVADALVLMRLSDLNLIIFKVNYSKKDFIKSANRFVHEHELDNVGMILNALELKKIRPWLRK